MPLSYARGNTIGYESPVGLDVTLASRVNFLGGVWLIEEMSSAVIALVEYSVV